MRCLVEMHQYCLFNCACYIINTHTDMTWIWYDKGIRGEELEKEWSECIFHELQSSPAKVLDMMFQFERRKGGTEGRRRKYASVWQQTWDFGCNCPRADMSASPFIHLEFDFDRPYVSLLAIKLGSCSKKTCKFNITSSHLFTSTDVSTSDGLRRYCSCWYLIKVKAGFL